jgi:hypothetical protein
MALDLFGKLKARRLAGSNAAAEAERELHRLSVRQARQAVAAAHNALANGWERRALLAVRRGLRVAPDDAELLSMLRELQGAETDQDPQRARRRALNSQVRAAVDLLRQRKLEESLAMLRAVLREDPDNVRAQEAVQQVRRAWLRRTVPPVPAAATPPPAVAAPAVVERVPMAAADTLRMPAVQAWPAAPPEVPVRARPAAPTPVASFAAAPPAPPPRADPPAAPALEDTVRVPTRTLRPPFRPPPPEWPSPARRGLPRGALFVFAGGVGIAAVVAFVLTRERPVVSAPAVTLQPAVAAPLEPASPAAPIPPPDDSAPAAPAAEPPGPLTDLDPDLRRTIERTLAAYGEALERQDESALARARPDLGARQRTTLLAPFKGALNVAVDLRVVDASARANDAVVTVLRTDVIVDGRGGARPPVEETLRYVRRGDGWALGGVTH